MTFQLPLVSDNEVPITVVSDNEVSIHNRLLFSDDEVSICF